MVTMKQTNISTLKKQLSEYIGYVRRGGIVRVFDRNEPVAEIVPLGRREKSKDDEWEARLQRLEREGSIRRGTGKLSRDFLTRRLPRAKKSVVEALLEERREGR